MARGMMKLVTPKRSNGAKMIAPPKPVKPPVMQPPKQAEVKLLPPQEDWIDLALEEHIRGQNAEPMWGEPRPLSKGWTPSSIGEPNDRAIVAKCLGYNDEPIGKQLQLIFDTGNDIEARWVRRFKEMGVLAGNDIWLPGARRSGLMFRGKVDMIVRHKYEPDRKILIEMKSIAVGLFNDLPPISRDPVANYDSLMLLRGYLGDRIRKYMAQLQVYLYEMNMDEGLMFFESKDNQRQAKYPIVQMPHMLDEVFERLKMLQDEYWSRGLLPPWKGSDSNKSLLKVYRTDEVVPIDEMKAQFDPETF